MMKNAGAFMDELKSFDTSDPIPEHVLEAVERLTAQPFFNYEVMKGKSSACAELAEWVINIASYSRMVAEANASIAPVKEKLNATTDLHDEATSKLEANTKALDIALKADARAKEELLLRELTPEQLEERAQEAEVVATEAVKSIDRRDFMELKVLARPPPAVVDVCAACALLLGGGEGQEKTWLVCQNVMGDSSSLTPNFLESLLNFDATQIPVDTLEQINGFLELPYFNFGSMCRFSRCSANLAYWVINIVQIHKMRHRVPS